MWLDIKIHKDAKNYQPYLNGEILNNCFAANEEEGWADVFVMGKNGMPVILVKDKDGKVIREHDGGEASYLGIGEKTWELKTERVFGKIELRRVK